MRKLAAVAVMLTMGLLTACTTASGPQQPASQPGLSGVSATANVPGFTSTQPASASQPSVKSRLCDPVLWQHVYHPQRLHILVNGCVTVTGTVAGVRKEPDGDYHIMLRLDPADIGYINSVNVAEQHGDLVLEPVCSNQVTQADAVAACAGYHSDVPVVQPGQHIAVTGSFVLDAEHGWNELHPVKSIRFLSS